jgi:ubiquinone biosynthesis protein COQ9
MKEMLMKMLLVLVALAVMGCTTKEEEARLAAEKELQQHLMDVESAKCNKESCVISCGVACYSLAMRVDPNILNYAGEKRVDYAQYTVCKEKCGHPH